MKILTVMFLFALFAASASAQSMADNPLHTEDEAAIHVLVQQIQDAWNAGSGDDFAAPYAEDAEYVIINGQHIKGRSVIATGHQQIFDTFYKGSQLAYTVKQLRFLRPDVALVHVSGVLTVADGSQTHALISLVLTKEGGTWQIDAFQNTEVEQRGE